MAALISLLFRNIFALFAMICILKYESINDRKYLLNILSDNGRKIGFLYEKYLLGTKYLDIKNDRCKCL